MKLPSFRAARAKLATSADVAAEVNQHRRWLAEAAEALAALDAARHEILIGDDVGAIRDHKAKSDEARTTVERLEARLEALAGQAAAIATREASDALDARRAAVEARATEGAAWLRDTYPEIAHALVDGLTSLHAAEHEIMELNAELVEAGRDEAQQLAGIQARLGIYAGGAGMEQGMALVAGSNLSLGSATRILELVGGVRAPGWTPRSWS